MIHTMGVGVIKVDFGAGEQMAIIVKSDRSHVVL